MSYQGGNPEARTPIFSHRGSYIPVKSIDPLHVHRDIGTSPSKDGRRFCLSLVITEAKTEQLVHIVGLKESPLFGVLQDSVSEELLENLSTK